MRRRRCLPLAALLLCIQPATPAFAQAAYLVADLGEQVLPKPDLFLTPETAASGGLRYFYLDDGIHGRELWRSDGTPLGTFLVRDVCPGSCGSQTNFRGLIAPLSNGVAFAANDGVHGLELWYSDGTALGTRRIADLRPGFLSSIPRLLTPAAGQVFFVALDGSGHGRLWRTDGTAKGTYTISPLGATGDFAPTSLHAGESLIYLCNVSSTLGTGLWRSDGTSAGTVFVSPVSCWQSALGKLSSMAVLPGDRLLFQGASGDQNWELWRSDGTAAGTELVAEIQPGPNPSYPASFAVNGSELYFTARGPGLAGGIWRTDGTPSGTAPISLADGAEPDLRGGLWAVVDGNYFFSAYDAGHGLEPWVFDGASAQRIVDLAPGPASSLDLAAGAFSSSLFGGAGAVALFTADDGISGVELWRTDGTESGTTRVSEIGAGEEGLLLPSLWSFVDLTGSGSTFTFLERSLAAGYRLWRYSEGASFAEPLRIVNDQRSTFAPAERDRAFVFGSEAGLVCFAGSSSDLYFERFPELAEGEQPTAALWRSDGSASGTELRLPGWPATISRSCLGVDDRLLYVGGPAELRAVLSVGRFAGDELALTAGFDQFNTSAFVARDGIGYFQTPYDAYRTDGLEAGTAVIGAGFDLYTSTLHFWSGGALAANGNLWRLTPEFPDSPIPLTSFDGGLGEGGGDHAIGVGDGILFLAQDSAHGFELWGSAGQPLDAALVKDIRAGSASSIGSVVIDIYSTLRLPKLATLGQAALLAADDGTHGSELWVSDGTTLGTQLLKDIYPGDYPSTPRNLTRFGDRVFFTAESELEGLELWATDGTVAGTLLVKDIAPGAASSIPDDLVVADGVLYFSAWSPNHGREAWKSDGSAAGTLRITDLAPGPKSSSPQRFTRAGNRLYFSATDHLHGYELWAISDDGTIPLFLDGFENESTGRWSATAP